MFGAIIGDIAGSTYEHDNDKTEDCEIFREYSKFTDDTVLTLATAYHLSLIVHILKHISVLAVHIQGLVMVKIFENGNGQRILNHTIAGEMDPL